MYQHGTPIVLNGKLLKNPNLASHYACMRHLGVIYGQASQSLPRPRSTYNLDLKGMVKELLLRGILLIPIAQNRKLLKSSILASHYACMRHLGVIYGQASQSLPSPWKT